jgi:hypothetical protein
MLELWKKCPVKCKQRSGCYDEAHQRVGQPYLFNLYERHATAGSDAHFEISGTICKQGARQPIGVRVASKSAPGQLPLLRAARLT